MVSMLNGSANFFDQWKTSTQSAQSPTWGTDARANDNTFEPAASMASQLHRAWDQQQQQAMALSGSGRAMPKKTTDELMAPIPSWGQARDPTPPMPSLQGGMMPNAMGAESPTMLMGGLGMGGMGMGMGLGIPTALSNFATMPEGIRNGDTSPPPLEAMPREPAAAPKTTESPRSSVGRAAAAQPITKPATPRAQSSSPPANSRPSLLSKPKTIFDASGDAMLQAFNEACPAAEMKEVKFFTESG